MTNKQQLNKTLECLPLSSIIKTESYRIYNKNVDTGINESTSRAGVINPFTVIKKDDKYYLLDGFHRHDYMEENYPPETTVPVWVIYDDLSEEQTLMLILDLARTKRKSYVDILAEFHLYNRLIPNNQGKSDVENPRKKEISQRIGVSVSTINRLLFIDRVSPALIHAATHGVITLEKANIDAKSMLRERKRREENEDYDLDLPDEDNNVESPEDGSPEADSSTVKSTRESRRPIVDKIIDLNSIADCCPTCNRGYDSIDWKQVRSIFNQKRKLEDQQTDWLEQAS